MPALGTYVAISIQTTGLEKCKLEMVEVAFQILDTFFEPKSPLVCGFVQHEGPMEPGALNVHGHNGMIEELRATPDADRYSAETFDSVLCTLMAQHVSGRPMLLCNSPKFTREVMSRHMPKSLEALRGDSFDVSTVRTFVCAARGQYNDYQLRRALGYKNRAESDVTIMGEELREYLQLLKIAG